MWIIVLIYIIIGVILNFIGPVAKFIRDTIKDLHDQSESYINKDGTASSKRKIVLAEIFLRWLVLLLYPFAYLVVLIDCSKKSSKKHEYKKQKKLERVQKMKDVITNKSFLYFKDIFGGGIIRCHGCGFKEEINCSTHGFSHIGDFYNGYQCQSCGKFHIITSYGNEKPKINNCSCGGKLSRENPIFCPKCKTTDVSYLLRYMT